MRYGEKIIASRGAGPSGECARAERSVISRTFIQAAWRLGIVRMVFPALVPEWFSVLAWTSSQGRLAHLSHAGVVVVANGADLQTAQEEPELAARTVPGVLEQVGLKN
jgi:hypothetical protein